MELYGNGESTVVVFVYLLVNLLLRVYGSGRYGEKLRELGESSDGLGQSGGGLSGSGKFAVRINKIRTTESVTSSQHPEMLPLKKPPSPTASLSGIEN